MMTKERAIKFANCLKNNYTIDFNDMADFCDTVIKALEQQPDDCVSRQAVTEYLEQLLDGRFDDIMSAAIMGIKDNINAMPPVTHTHGTCKDCKYWCQYDGLDTCRLILRTRHRDFYCADYVKRGNEND